MKIIEFFVKFLRITENYGNKKEHKSPITVEIIRRPEYTKKLKPEEVSAHTLGLS
jgi:hypothetical protein